MEDPRREAFFEFFKNSVVPLTPASKRVYTEGLLLWLGVVQQFEELSCAEVLEELESAPAQELMGNCARKAKGRISHNTGAFVQARQELGRDVLSAALHGTYWYARRERIWKDYQLVAVDGSTVQLQCTNAALRKAFPGGRDHKRISRWPMVHLALCVDLLEGTVVGANLGAKYGPKAQSEIELCLPLFKQLNERSLLIADRNFDTFHAVKQLESRGAKSLIRVTSVVGKYLNGGVVPHDGTDRKVQWICTAEVAKKHGYTVGECLTGRLLAQSVLRKGKKVKVTLFTTVTEASAEELVELYTRRWAIETDLRYLKQQLRLRQVQATHPKAVEVEIFCKLLAFNITRGLVLLAVHGTDIEPREISFLHAWRLLRYRLADYCYAENNEEKDAVIERLIASVRHFKIPKRPNRSYPRQVYSRRPCRYKQVSSALKKTKRH